MDQIDLVIMNTITPDHADPGCAFFLQAKLGLPGIPVLDIKQQCAGLIYGLALADHFVRAGHLSPRAGGLCRGALRADRRLVRRPQHRHPPGRRRGGGGGRPVARRRQRGILSTILHADGRHAKALYTAAPGSGLGRKEHITKDDIDAGRVHFRMDGKAVFQNGVDKMSEAVFESLQANGLHAGPDRRAGAAPGQPADAGGDRRSGSGIPREKVFVNVEEYGNIASASLPIALHEARQTGMIRPGSLVLLVAFGSGFVWGSALLRA